MFDSNMIEDAGHDKIDQIVDGCRVMVKAGHGRQNRRTGSRRFMEIFKVNKRERSLARNENQRTFFLQVHIGRPMNEIPTRTGHDAA